MPEDKGLRKADPEAAGRLADLLKELGSPWRLLMLDLLRQGPSRMVDLARALEIAPQEASRHLGRLAGLGLVARDLEGDYNLTALGRLMLEGTSWFRALCEAGDVFSEHDLSVVPGHLRLGLGVLAGRSMEKPATEVLRAGERIIGNAAQRLHVLSDEILWSAVEVFAEKSRKGVECRLLLPEDLVRSPDFRAIPYNRFDWNFLTVARLPKVPLSLVLTEAEALLALPNRRGVLDFTAAFYGKEPDFLSLAEAVFASYWERSTKIRPRGGSSR